MNCAAFFLRLLAVCLLFTACGCKQSPSATAVGKTDSGPTDVVTASGVEMISLPDGSFTMGTADGPAEEGPPHKVSLTAFLIDKYEVTHEMFAKVQLPDPSHWQENPKGPVERVRWRDAKAYCNERSRLEGLKPCYNEKTKDWECDYSASGYRLPTEAEWEYAARAGSDSAYEFGSPDALRQYAWFADNAEQKTHAVGSKKPNGWGLFDMLGNVSEWCEDVYSADYYSHSASADPTGPASAAKDAKRVIRGGNWNASAANCRVTWRQGQRTGNTDACFSTDYCGFRCVRRATPDEIAKLRHEAPGSN